MKKSIGDKSVVDMKISLIIPVYNEEDAIPLFIDKINATINYFFKTQIH
jgi:hypothetical protein